jgi:hypothetical protein
MRDIFCSEDNPSMARFFNERAALLGSHRLRSFAFTYSIVTSFGYSVKARS